jgi:peptide/nickel transport system permease protein
MSAYITRRILHALIVIFIVSLVVFFMMRLLPGDPVLMYMSQQQFQSLSEEQIAIVKHDFGLDKSLLVQYIDWVGGLFRGNLGKSLFYREDVIGLIVWRLPITLYLGLISFVISTLLGIVAGVLSAVRRGKVTDFLVTVGANIGITIPIFWLGILLIYLFGLKLRVLPIQGYTSPFTDFSLNMKQMVMPVICLAIFTIGAVARQARSSMLEVINQDYIRTAWSKGLQERSIVMKHALKNGLIPIVTLSGMQVSQILGGAVLIETVFNIPGMGRLAVDALLSLDYAVVQAIALFTAIMVVMANVIVDISYGWLDPRIRYT